MFSFFKKKKVEGRKFNEERVASNPRDVNITAILKAVELLVPTYDLFRDLPNFSSVLEQKRVRGYLIGFFDCSLQQLGHPPPKDEDFFELVILGHAALLGDAGGYAITSLKLEGDPELKEGQIEGGTECYRLLTGKTTCTTTFLNYFAAASK